MCYDSVLALSINEIMNGRILGNLHLSRRGKSTVRVRCQGVHRRSGSDFSFSVTGEAQKCLSVFAIL